MIADLHSLFIEPFSDFAFMQRALWGCFVLSLSATPIGVFLTLRKMSLTGDAMSHAILPGAAIGFLISGVSVIAMTIGGVIAGCIVAILAGVVARHSNAEEDSSLATFYLLSLASGVLIISLKGSNIDLLHVLFGSTLALNNEALILLTSIATVTLLTLAVLYRPLVFECVDPAFFRSISKLSAVAHYGFLLLVVLNLVAGFHALGTLMAVGLMLIPAAIARFWTVKLGRMLVIAFMTSVVSCYLGLFISFHVSYATSPAIILVMGCIYIVSLFFGQHSGLFIKKCTTNRTPNHQQTP